MLVGIIPQPFIECLLCARHQATCQTYKNWKAATHGLNELAPGPSGTFVFFSVAFHLCALLPPLSTCIPNHL